MDAIHEIHRKDQFGDNVTKLKIMILALLPRPTDVICLSVGFAFSCHILYFQSDGEILSWMRKHNGDDTCKCVVLFWTVAFAKSMLGQTHKSQQHHFSVGDAQCIRWSEFWLPYDILRIRNIQIWRRKMENELEGIHFFKPIFVFFFQNEI